MTGTTEQQQQSAPQPQQPRKRRHIFRWVFLAVQALFIILLIVFGTASTGPDHGEVLAACNNHGWYPLFNSMQDCINHSGQGIIAAKDFAKGVSIILIIGLWVAADFILGISYLIWRAASKR